MNELMTPRGEALTGTPWDVYPRPQLRRESYVNLNGTWDFAVTAGPSPESYDREIRVPYCPESALSGCGSISQRALLCGTAGRWPCLRASTPGGSSCTSARRIRYATSSSTAVWWAIMRAAMRPSPVT